MTELDFTKISTFISKKFDETIIPTLCEYIKIPNLSPDFDPEGKAIIYQDKAVQLLMEWVSSQGYKPEKIVEGKRTPLILVDIPATHPKAKTVLMYGHLDKQPPFEGWDEGLGPYNPVIKDGKLYGRGAADDGYAIFASVTAVKALDEFKIPHGRILIVIEAAEESTSEDLVYYLNHHEKLKNLGDEIELVICLDSGCGNYEQLWLTTSLRGILGGKLTVSIIKEGQHSGAASGIVPDTFRICRMLLSRLEDEKTGKIIPKEFYVEIPKIREKQAQECAEILGNTVYEEFPFLPNAKPVTDDLKELILNRTWRPQLAVTGASGLPIIENASNTLRPYTSLKISLRIPPTLDPEKGIKALKDLLEKDSPYGAQVKFEDPDSAPGWESPVLSEWLEKAVEKASQKVYGKKVGYLGEGGSIPFMGLLGQRFPKSQFVITGVLGPKSNAHGPNEFLHIDYTKKIITCISSILADHAVESSKSSH